MGRYRSADPNFDTRGFHAVGAVGRLECPMTRSLDLSALAKGQRTQRAPRPYITCIAPEELAASGRRRITEA